jgi:tetratricopeptide (TPR) repeat protein
MSEHAPASPATAAAIGRAKVFVSYSRKDLPFAQGLVEALGARGFDAFLDKTDIAPGEPWKERLAGLIAAADTVVFAISPDSITSNVCAWELEETARLGKRLIPVVARSIPDADAPPALGRLNWVFLTERDDKAAAMAALESALHTDLPWVREHTRLGELARRWDEQGRRNSATLRGGDLDAAERWLDRRPADANAPTDLHQDFIRASRRAATSRQRMWVGGSLAVAILAIGLAVFAEISRRDAQAQRDRAERTLTLATGTANGLVTDLAQKFRNTVGVPAVVIKDILDRARKLQDQLLGSGESAPELRKSQAEALMEASRTLLVLGETTAALSAATQARDVLQVLVQQQPNNAEFEVQLSVAYSRMGDVQVEQGELTQALQAYNTCVAIDEGMTKSDPANVERQQDLAVDYQRIGNVLLVQRNWAEALKSFRASLEIFDRLAKADPDNTRKQRDVSVSDQKIGDVLVGQGNLPEALKSYRDGLAIDNRLAASEPGNAQLQRDLAVMYGKIGEVLLAQTNLPEALKSFQAGLAITNRLAKSDPSNHGWQRDLAVSYNEVGDVLEQQHNLPEALNSYRTAFEITDRLAKSDPSNATWQNDLSASYERIGDVLQEQGKYPEALEAYRPHLEISERLAQADPGIANLQDELAAAYSRIANAQGFGGDWPAAMASLQTALAIRDRLAKADPGNPFRQNQLALSYSRLVTAYKQQKDLAEMRKALDAGREIVLRLVAAYPDAALYKEELAWFDGEIAAAGN